MSISSIGNNYKSFYRYDDANTDATDPSQEYKGEDEITVTARKQVDDSCGNIQLVNFPSGPADYVDIRGDSTPRIFNVNGLFIPEEANVIAAHGSDEESEVKFQINNYDNAKPNFKNLTIIDYPFLSGKIRIEIDNTLKTSTAQNNMDKIIESCNLINTKYDDLISKCSESNHISSSLESMKNILITDQARRSGSNDNMFLMKSSEISDVKGKGAISVFSSQIIHDGYHMVQKKEKTATYSIKDEIEATKVQLSACDVLGVDKNQKKNLEFYINNPYAIANRMEKKDSPRYPKLIDEANNIIEKRKLEEEKKQNIPSANGNKNMNKN